MITVLTAAIQTVADALCLLQKWASKCLIGTVAKSISMKYAVNLIITPQCLHQFATYRVAWHVQQTWLTITNQLMFNAATHNIAPMTEEKGISTISLKSFCPSTLFLFQCLLFVQFHFGQYSQSLYVFVNVTVLQFNHKIYI